VNSKSGCGLHIGNNEDIGKIICGETGLCGACTHRRDVLEKAARRFWRKQTTRHSDDLGRALDDIDAQEKNSR
jgi:hypothetical protein